MPQESNKGLIGLLVIIVVFFTVFAIFTLYTIKKIGFSEKDEVVGYGKNPSGEMIGVVEIKGLIYESRDWVEMLQKAEKDDEIRAIIVRIESPGGAVGPTQEVYQEIIRIDKEKPVYASFGSIAASGGYYIGSAARKIFANPGTLTGSIGVIMEFMDLSQLYKFAKVDPYPMKSGRYKDMGDTARKLTAEENALIQDVLDSVHDQFKEDILKRRKDKIKGKFVDIAQGQIFSGSQALKIGLVDELGSLWASGRSIQKELNIKGDLRLKFIKMKKDFSWIDFFKNIEESVTRITGFAGMGKIPMFLYGN